jgi:hypothetical protein
MEITANLLKLANEWIIAQVEEVEGATSIGDPDCVLREPYVVECGGEIYSWPRHSNDREVVVRSSDITTLVNPSTKLLAAYLLKVDPPKPPKSE